MDWQRPVVAPPDIDLVALLVGQAIDPRPHVSATAFRAFWFLRLHWAVEAQAHLFPGSRWPLFDHWVSLFPFALVLLLCQVVAHLQQAGAYVR